MDIGELDITLRRRQRPEDHQRLPALRLPGNLRQLGARGAVTRPGASQGQRTVVKVMLPRGAGRGTRQELAYLQYEKGSQRTQAPLYGPGAQDPQAFARAARHDPHQFRIIVSTPDDALGDQRTAFVEGLMHQMARDLGRELAWVAANHYDRPHRHTHIILRGVAQGEVLYMTKSYFEHGIRDRADALLTRLLGPRVADQHRYQVDQAYAQERLALNGMVRGLDDPDIGRLVRSQSSVQRQALAGQMGSYRQDHGTGEVLARLGHMQARLQALHSSQQRSQIHGIRH